MKKTRFSQILLLFFLIMTVSSLCISKDKQFTSQWEVKPATLSSSNTSWNENTFFSEKKVKIDYAFKNDAENLYVLFIFKDPKYLSNIEDTGITLWLNTEGKKKKRFGIKFVERQITADKYISLLEKNKARYLRKGKKRFVQSLFIFSPSLKS